jgi:hypothetical protein
MNRISRFHLHYFEINKFIQFTLYYPCNYNRQERLYKLKMIIFASYKSEQENPCYELVLQIAAHLL